jgi:hypothetical protein
MTNVNYIHQYFKLKGWLVTEFLLFLGIEKQTIRN